MSAQTDGAATRRGPMGGHGPGHGMMPGEKYLRHLLLMPYLRP